MTPELRGLRRDKIRRKIVCTEKAKNLADCREGVKTGPRMTKSKRLARE